MIQSADGKWRVRGLGDGVECSGDAAFAVGPRDVAGWLSEGRVVLGKEVGVDQSIRRGSMNGRRSSFSTTPIWCGENE